MTNTTTAPRSPRRVPVSTQHSQKAHDEDLERRVALFLVLRGVFREKEFRVRAENGTVTIRGRLPSPQAKRLCLDCCRYVAGVTKVIDKLEVEVDGKSSSSKTIEAFSRTQPH